MLCQAPEIAGMDGALGRTEDMALVMEMEDMGEMGVVEEMGEVEEMVAAQEMVAAVGAAAVAEGVNLLL